MPSYYLHKYKLHCANCGYRVKGWSSSKCPECGTDIDEIPAIPLPHKRNVWIVRALQIFILMWLCLVVTMRGPWVWANSVRRQISTNDYSVVWNPSLIAQKNTPPSLMWTGIFVSTKTYNTLITWPWHTQAQLHFPPCKPKTIQFAVLVKVSQPNHLAASFQMGGSSGIRLSNMLFDPQLPKLTFRWNGKHYVLTRSIGTVFKKGRPLSKTLLAAFLARQKKVWQKAFGKSIPTLPLNGKNLQTVAHDAISNATVGGHISTPLGKLNF